jgi:hypothetical protein
MREVVEGARDWLARNGPGVLLSLTAGMGGTFVANVYGGSTVLFGLLLGKVFNFISAESRFDPGVGLSSRSILLVALSIKTSLVALDKVGSRAVGLHGCRDRIHRNSSFPSNSRRPMSRR